MLPKHQKRRGKRGGRGGGRGGGSGPSGPSQTPSVYEGIMCYWTMESRTATDTKQLVSKKKDRGPLSRKYVFLPHHPSYGHGTFVLDERRPDAPPSDDDDDDDDYADIGYGAAAQPAGLLNSGETSAPSSSSMTTDPPSSIPDFPLAAVTGEEPAPLQDSAVGHGPSYSTSAHPPSQQLAAHPPSTASGARVSAAPTLSTPRDWVANRVGLREWTQRRRAVGIPAPAAVGPASQPAEHPRALDIALPGVVQRAPALPIRPSRDVGRPADTARLERKEWDSADARRARAAYWSPAGQNSGAPAVHMGGETDIASGAPPAAPVDLQLRAAAPAVEPAASSRPMPPPREVGRATGAARLDHEDWDSADARRARAAYWSPAGQTAGGGRNGRSGGTAMRLGVSAKASAAAGRAHQRGNGRQRAVM
ncbi:hypothetical protein FA95DRAFT_1609451 [Auriscalpium vulgare]|uniref:Uncharacterized protein n=1 Tax=Auriscalpium vulgare TaxID=40419 RepID=A0ACB8RHI9_9AGAM|nr:hypothetical protein FA95DRAFT_1609451 [Auriscalpium vulgare]